MSASVSPMSQHATLTQQGSLSSRNDAHMAELEGSPAGAYGHPMASTQGQSLPPIAVDPTLGFAEKVENPAPQVVFDNGAEVVREGIQPDATRDELPQAVLVVGEKVPFWKKKSTIIAICILGLLAITGLVLGVLGGTGVFSHKNEIDALLGSSTGTGVVATTTSASSSISSTLTTLITTTSSATAPSSSATIDTVTGPPPSSPSQCLQDTNHVGNVSQITGLVKAHDRGFDFAQADNLVQCCTICYMLTTTAYESCDLWVYDGTSANVPCIIVRGYIGANPDRNCKYGHTKVNDFSIKLGGNAVAGPGPCGPDGVGLPGPD